jgi:hypothetical protein
MTEPTPPIGDIRNAWTDAERDVWNAWSTVEQDVSRPETADGCGHLLDALEASAQEVARLQSAAVRCTFGGRSAIPLLPREAQVWVEQACRPVLSLADFQPHVMSARFGMARQMAISVSGSGSGLARADGSGAQAHTSL